VRDYAIYMLDREGNVTNWNAGAEAIKGYSAEEIVGQHFSQFYTEEDRAKGEHLSALETALREGKYEREALRVRKDGSLFWASVVSIRSMTKTGRHVGFAKITRDVSDRKRADEELEEARAASAQAKKLQALGELTGGIAHDFNNLLTVIAGSSDILLKRPDMPEDKRRQYLEAIVETTKRQRRSPAIFLPSGGGSRYAPKSSTCTCVWTRSSRSCPGRSAAASRSGSTFSDQGSRSGGSARIRDSDLNAVFNARDAMPEGGTLTFSTADSAQGLIAITIADTGFGCQGRAGAGVRALLHHQARR
jgi:PAS domain S-box-containing protein